MEMTTASAPPSMKKVEKMVTSTTELTLRQMKSRRKSARARMRRDEFVYTVRGGKVMPMSAAVNAKMRKAALTSVP
jgi:hypothetical protein